MSVKPQLPPVTVHDQELLHAYLAVKRRLFFRLIIWALYLDQKIRTTHPVGFAIDGPATVQDHYHIGRSKFAFPTETPITDVRSGVYPTASFQGDHVKHNGSQGKYDRSMRVRCQGRRDINSFPYFIVAIGGPVAPVLDKLADQFLVQDQELLGHF